MPKVTYLDVLEREGALRQVSGTVSAEDLQPAGSDRRMEPESPWLRRYRVVGRAKQALGLGHELASLQSAFYRAALTLLDSPRLLETCEQRSLTVTLNPIRRNINVLRGRDFSENLGVWIRNGSPDEMLVELSELDRDRLRAAVCELETYAKQLAALTFPGAQAQSATSRVLSRGTAPLPADVAAQRRLAQGWLLASTVSELMGSNASNASVMANQRRREGDLLGVWIPSERAYRYPPWQFDHEGQPVPQLGQVLALLRGPGGMGSTDRHTSGWQEVEWFMSPHALLEGSRPYEVLRDDPRGFWRSRPSSS